MEGGKKLGREKDRRIREKIRRHYSLPPLEKKEKNDTKKIERVE